MWLNKDKDWTEKIQGILGGADMGLGLPGPDYLQNLIGQSNVEPGKLSIGGLLQNVAGNIQNKSGGLTQNIAKNIGEGGASNIVNKKNMPWLYDDIKPKGVGKDPSDVMKQLELPFMKDFKGSGIINRALQIAHGMPRYIKGKAPSGVINKAPHLDSPYIDEQIRRNFQPMELPGLGGGGPSLPDFVRRTLPDDDIRNLLIRAVA